MKLINLIFVIGVLFSLSNNSFSKPAKDAATIKSLIINSHGLRMTGIAYLASGTEPHPTLLLLHGYPGFEKNLDVAQAMRRRNWNVIFFHYRGAWGSEGEFSFLSAEQDVQSALQFILNKKNAKALNINRDLVSIIGHSMGGHMAIAGILDNQKVKCAISYDGANLGVEGIGLINDRTSKINWESFSDSLFMLKGWSGKKATSETRKFVNRLNLINRTSQLNNRPVLFVAANSSVIPMSRHIMPLVKAFKQKGNTHVNFELIEDDHSFSSFRRELIGITDQFLSRHCVEQ